MKRVFFLAAAILLVICGCQTAPLPAAGGSDSGGGTEYCQQADQIIRAIAEKNFSDYIRSAGEASGIDGKEKFLSSCKDMESRLGKMGKYTFIPELQTPEVTSLVYRVDFCRTSESGKKIEHQQLFQLVFGKVDGQAKLFGMRIM